MALLPNLNDFLEKIKRGATNTIGQARASSVVKRFQLPGQQSGKPISVGRAPTQLPFQPQNFQLPGQRQNPIQVGRTIPIQQTVQKGIQDFQTGFNDPYKTSLNQPFSRTLGSFVGGSPVGGIAKYQPQNIKAIVEPSKQLAKGQITKQQLISSLTDFEKSDPLAFIGVSGAVNKFQKPIIDALKSSKNVGAARAKIVSLLKNASPNVQETINNVLSKAKNVKEAVKSIKRMNVSQVKGAKLVDKGDDVLRVGKNQTPIKPVEGLTFTKQKGARTASFKQKPTFTPLDDELINFTNLPKNLVRAAQKGPSPSRLSTDLAKSIGTATREGIDVAIAKPYKGNIFRQLKRRLFNSVEGVFRKEGRAGNKLADMVRQARDLGETQAGRAVVKIKNPLKGLSEKEIQKFADIAEGTAVADTPRLKKALQVWDEIRRDIATQAQEAGLQIRVGSKERLIPFQPRDNFFPHFVPEEIINNARARKDAMVRLVQRGWARSVAEAESKFQAYIKRQVKRRYGNLEYAREIDFPLYEKDPRKVLFQYIDSAYQRIADAKTFGADDFKAYQLADEIGLQGGDADFAKTALDQIFGKNSVDEFTKKLTSGLTGFQTVTKLGLAAVINLGQSISTALRTRGDITARVIARSLGKNRQEQVEFAEMTGVILRNSIDDFLKQIGGDQKITGKFLRKVGFIASEKYNRIVASNAGKLHLESLASRLVKNPKNKALARAIKRLGVSPRKILKQGKATLDDQIKAGRTIVEETQFKTDPFDLPLAWTSPWGRVATQFKSFAFKQTKLLGRHSKTVAKETIKGNFAPLANTLLVMGVAAPLAGEVIQDVRAFLANKKRTDKGLERYLNNTFTTLSLGLLEDVGTLLTGKYGAGGTIGLVGGPTGSDVFKGIQAGQSLFRDRKTLTGADEVKSRTKPLGKFLTREIPVAGPALQNTFFESDFSESMFGANAPSEFEKQVQQKKRAVDLYIEGKREGNEKKVKQALDLKKQYGFSILEQDVKTADREYVRPKIDEAIEHYLDGNTKKAEDIKLKNNLTIELKDVQRIAKKKAIKHYLKYKKRGSVLELRRANLLKQKYQFKISQKDIEGKVSQPRETSPFDFLGF